MALIEVEDQIIAALAQNGIKYTDASGKIAKGAEVEAAWQKLLSGPDRLTVLQAYKRAYPNASVPEIDAAAPVNDAVAAIRKEFDEYRAAADKEKEETRAKAREEAANGTVAKGRQWLRGDKKLDDDGVTAVEKVMQDLGVPNYEVAFNHWRASQPADPEQLPSSWAGRSLDWFREQEDRPDLELLRKDPMAYRRKETGKVLAEIREGKFAA
jgi:hypothetical protein